MLGGNNSTTSLMSSNSSSLAGSDELQSYFMSFIKTIAPPLLASAPALANFASNAANTIKQAAIRAYNNSSFEYLGKEKIDRAAQYFMDTFLPKSPTMPAVTFTAAEQVQSRSVRSVQSQPMSSAQHSAHLTPDSHLPYNFRVYIPNAYGQLVATNLQKVIEHNYSVGFSGQGITLVQGGIKGIEANRLGQIAQQLRRLIGTSEDITTEGIDNYLATNYRILMETHANIYPGLQDFKNFAASEKIAAGQNELLRLNYENALYHKSTVYSSQSDAMKLGACNTTVQVYQPSKFGSRQKKSNPYHIPSCSDPVKSSQGLANGVNIARKAGARGYYQKDEVYAGAPSGYEVKVGKSNTLEYNKYSKICPNPRREVSMDQKNWLQWMQNGIPKAHQNILSKKCESPYNIPQIKSFTGRPFSR